MVVVAILSPTIKKSGQDLARSEISYLVSILLFTLPLPFSDNISFRFFFRCRFLLFFNQTNWFILGSRRRRFFAAAAVLVPAR